MFGYIKACKPELKVKEAEIYKSVYCGLCKELKRKYGMISRVNLSYDLVFLALVGMAASGEKAELQRCSCMLNPLKKKNCCSSNNSLSLSADFSVLLTYHKICDDINDEGFFKSFLYRLLRIIYKPIYKKASKNLPLCNIKIAEEIKRLNEAEKDESATFDECCDPFSSIISLAFSSLSEDDTTKRVIEEFGYFIGRYIYIIDAIDDYKKDKEKNRFNLLKNKCKETENIVQYCKNSLLHSIDRINAAYNLLTLNSLKPITDNIITIGLYNTMNDVLKKTEENLK